MLKRLGKFLGLALLIGMIAGIAYADVTTGIAGYWPLDGNAKDKSGKGSDGVAMGNPEWVTGRAGQAVKLAGAVGGVNQRIDLSTFKLTSDTVTIAVWLKGWKNDGWTGIMMSRGTTGTANGIGFGDGDALHYTWSANTTWQWHKGPVIPKETWALVAVAIDPKKATEYLFTDADGLKSAANETAHPAETIDKMQIGNDACCGDTRWVVGLMDEAVIYNRTLTKDDILELATKGLTTAVEASGKLATTWGTLKY